MNKMLPIYSKSQEILNAINCSDTVLLTAETGSGKSTQVPQMLYEAGYEVIVTQPRRIACVSLARRVAEELGAEDGVVAYHTAFESTRQKNTKVLFCTDGLQMARGIRDSQNTILVLDEVHEWNLNIETLVAWIKKFRADGHELKVILMSATIELKDLAGYYGDEAICIDIPGRMFDVEKRQVGPYMDQQIYDYASAGKNVLVFVEGKKEIDDVIRHLTEMELNAELIPLHGELQVAEQNRCFRHYSRTKVVVATNIAQTSVTIPDIDVVVDNGKEKRVEVLDGIEGLFTRDISKADCLQRAGRAGRTKDGIYVLCSYTSLEEREPYSIPEIQRLVLDKVVLKLMSVGIDPVSLEFFHQPDIASIITSITTLKMLGAITGDGKVTSMGKRIVMIPVAVRFARMLIEAERFGCVEKLIKAVSIMECGSLLNHKATVKDSWGWSVKVSYQQFSKQKRSDVLAEIEIFDKAANHEFENLIEAGINKKMFFRVKEFVTKLKTSLDGIVDISYDEPDEFTFVKCIAAGMPDNIYQYSYCGCYSVTGHQYNLKDTSPACYKNFAIGIPRTITYKDRYGWSRTMDILTMATGVTTEELVELAGNEHFELYTRYEDASYEGHADEFIVPVDRKCFGFRLDESYVCIGHDDPKYAELLEMHKDLVESKKVKTVLIGDHVYEISPPDGWLYKRSYIRITDDDDIMKSDIKTLKDSSGNPILFKYILMENENLDIIRQRIRYRRAEDARERALRSLPNGKTGSVKLIISDFLGKLGKVDCSVPEYGIEDYRYVGLTLNGESVAFKAFDDEESSVKSTTEALQFIIRKFINMTYPDKKFFVKNKQGKKIETKLTAEAKDEFHQYCTEIISDTTAENFAANVEFVGEIFEECVGKFAS